MPLSDFCSNGFIQRDISEDYRVSCIELYHLKLGHFLFCCVLSSFVIQVLLSFYNEFGNPPLIWRTDCVFLHFFVGRVLLLQ